MNDKKQLLWCGLFYIRPGIAAFLLLDIVLNVFPSSYWSNTSSNSIVKSLIERADYAAKQ